MADAEKKETKETGKTDQMKGYASKDVIANLFGLTGRRIDQLVEDGVIDRVHTSQGVRFEIGKTVHKYVKYLSDKAYGRERSETEAKLKEQKLRADVALKESQGELHRLRTEIAAGNYISVEEVQLEYQHFFVIFRKFALSLPSKLAGRLSGFVDPVEVRRIESDLKDDVNRLLKDFVIRAVVEKREPADVTKPKRKGRPRKNAQK